MGAEKNLPFNSPVADFPPHRLDLIALPPLKPGPRKVPGRRGWAKKAGRRRPAFTEKKAEENLAFIIATDRRYSLYAFRFITN